MKKLHKAVKERRLRLARAAARRMRIESAGGVRRSGDHPRESAVLNYLRDALGLRRRRRQHAVSVGFPRTFSFIENPDETIEAVLKVATALAEGARTLDVDHSSCTGGDHCAEAVVGALAREGRRSRLTSIRGRLPDDPEEKKRVIASGLPKHLGLSGSDHKDFHAFELRHGIKRKERAHRSSPREIVATQLTEFIDGCLGRYSLGLTDDAMEFISIILGEIVGNAEDHSRQPHWWASAYLHEERPGRVGDCHITIFNFGRSIADSIGTLPKGSILKSQIADLVAEHETRGWFGKDTWTPDELRTLYALQEGVSRFNTGRSHLDTDRGQGTADLIEFFQRLGKRSDGASEPRMCIVSGRTHILFDDRHRLALTEVSPGVKRRVISFNDARDLRLPPDQGYVRRLKKHFPGTLISMRFFFDKQYLQQSGGNGVHRKRV